MFHNVKFDEMETSNVSSQNYFLKISKICGKCLLVSSIYGNVIIKVIGAIFLGYMFREILFKLYPGLVGLTIIVGFLVTVIFVLGILLFVGVIKSSRRVVLAYLIVDAIRLTITTILQIVIIYAAGLNFFFLISGGIILIEWILLGTVFIYYKVLVDRTTSDKKNNCVEELLTEVS